MLTLLQACRKHLEKVMESIKSGKKKRLEEYNQVRSEVGLANYKTIAERTAARATRSTAAVDDVD